MRTHAYVILRDAGAELPEGLDADFEEHRTYIDSVLEDADNGGSGEPPEYPGHDDGGAEEEDGMDVDLHGEQAAAEELGLSDGLSDGEHGLPGGGSSDGEQEDFRDGNGEGYVILCHAICQVT